MKKALLLLMILPFLLLAKESGEKSKFYDFSDMMIDGDFKKPEMMSVRDKKSARFKRMFQLKRSFIPVLKESHRDDAIK